MNKEFLSALELEDLKKFQNALHDITNQEDSVDLFSAVLDGNTFFEYRLKQNAKKLRALIVE